MMDVYIDTRESVLNEKLNLKSKQLLLGDINILYDDQVKIVIERKTLSDLAQSIKDGRYKEQKFRTLEFQKSTNCKIVYLFEDFINFDVEFNKIFGLEMSTIKNAYINSMFRDKYYIVCTRNVDESAAFINTLIGQIKKNPLNYFNESNICQEEYEKCVINSKKKNHITKDNCLMLQIACIPGYSSKQASAIQKHFNVKNMKDLINAIEEKIISGVKNPLLEIKGIGKTMSQTFYDMVGIHLQNKN